ncbi:MAG: hypothetical protein NVS3B16_05970 [Vulcanimicrobiaceae bacterium]
MTVAWQGPFSGENAIAVAMDKQGLLQKRGLEAAYQEFGNGPSVNESVIAGRAQVGSGGNFPFTTLIDKSIPVVGLGTVAPNLEHCVIVANDSPLKKFKDLAGSKSPLAIGVVTGSSAEFYFQEAAKLNGVAIGKDVTLVNMSIPDQLALPRGIAAVVPWEPSCSVIADRLKTGRVIDTIFRYNIYQGTFFARSELAKNAPDVAQAITDAFTEATLWIRLNPQATGKLLAASPGLESYPEALLEKQTEQYNNLYKPTYVYPFAKFWGSENARIADFLYKANRISRKLSAADYQNAYDENFMNATFKKLGWKIPDEPPFIPAGWKGRVGQPPYPAYDNVTDMKSAQFFPQKGDLTKVWSFDGKTYRP